MYAEFNVDLNGVFLACFSDGEVPVFNLDFHVFELINDCILVFLSGLPNLLKFLGNADFWQNYAPPLSGESLKASVPLPAFINL
jgi:hypothetical protein